MQFFVDIGVGPMHVHYSFLKGAGHIEFRLSRSVECPMRNTIPNTEKKSSLSLRIGHWFEARGTGWGVVAIPVLLLLVAVLANSRFAG